MNKAYSSTSAVPLPQNPLRDALEKAVAVVHEQAPEQMEWLGATRENSHWELISLGERLTVDLETGSVNDSQGHPVESWWQILTLHYLSTAARPHGDAAEVTFADLPSGWGYASVYRQRVIGRLCRKMGCDSGRFKSAARALGGVPAEGGDAAFVFRPFPRIPMRLIWYMGDDEIESSATLLLAANIVDYFCLEDIVVLSEQLVARLVAASNLLPKD